MKNSSRKIKRDYITLVVMIGLSIGSSIGFYQCKKSSNNSQNSSPGPGTNEVFIQNMMFNPVSIAVPINTTIKWTNKDGVAHTVTSTTGLFNSGNIGSGSNYTHQFTTAGTYPYKCTLHSGMTGTVTVQQ